MIVEIRNEHCMPVIKNLFERFSSETNEFFKRQHTDFCSLMAIGFFEHNKTNEFVINDLLSFVMEFNKFLSKFNQYMDVEHYFFVTSEKLKELFLQSSMYINIELPSGYEWQIDSDLKRVNNSLFFMKKTFNMIVETIKDNVDELSRFLTKHEFFSSFEDSISTVSFSQGNENKFYLKVTTKPFKKFSLERISKYRALAKLRNLMIFDWEIELTYLSRFPKSSCAISFMKPLK